MEEIKVLEGNRYRVKIKDKCTFCNKEYLVRKSWKGKQKYCSSACSSKAFSNSNRTEVICSYCSTSFKKKNSSLINSRSGLYFCSREHKDLAQRIGGIEDIQPDHYGTGNGKYGYRKLAFDSFPNQCNSCGYKKYIEVLIVHHKDRNRDNNILDNLEILCPTCHMEEHFITSSGLWATGK